MRNIKKSATGSKPNNGLLRYLTGIFLASCSSAVLASAFFRFGKCKGFSGFKQMCKRIIGFVLIKCKLFSGRDKVLLSGGTQLNNWDE